MDIPDWIDERLKNVILCEHNRDDDILRVVRREASRHYISTVINRYDADELGEDDINELLSDSNVDKEAEKIARRAIESVKVAI